MEYNSVMDIVDGHLGCFQEFTIADNTAIYYLLLFTITDNTVMNICVQATLWPSVGREYSLTVNNMVPENQSYMPGLQFGLHSLLAIT